MIALKNSHQHLSDCNQFLFKKRIEFYKNNNKMKFSSEKIRNSIIVFMIMLTRYSERIFNPIRYTGKIFILSFWDSQILRSWFRNVNQYLTRTCRFEFQSKSSWNLGSEFHMWGVFLHAYIFFSRDFFVCNSFSMNIFFS